MTIEKINIVSFGTLSAVKAELTDRINLFDYERREIADFVAFMLYGFTSEEKRQRYINDATPVCEGSMQVKINKKSYKVTRRDDATLEAGACCASVIDIATNREKYLLPDVGTPLLGADSYTFSDAVFLTRFPEDCDSRGFSPETENVLYSADERISADRGAAILTALHNSAVSEGCESSISEKKAKSDELRRQLTLASDANKYAIECREAIADKERECAAANGSLYERAALERTVRHANVISEFDRLHEMEQLRETQKQKVLKYRMDNGYEGFCPSNDYRRDVALSFDKMRLANKKYNEAVMQYCQFNAQSSIDKKTEEIIRRAEALGGTEKVRARYNEAHSSFLILLGFSIISVIACMLIAVFGSFSDAVTQTPLLYCTWVGAIFATFAASAITAYLAHKNHVMSMQMASDFNVKERSELQSVLKKIEDARATVKARMETLASINALCDSTRAECDSALLEYMRAVEKWGRRLPGSNVDEFMYSLDIEIKEYIEGEQALLRELDATVEKIAELRSRLGEYNEIDVRADVLPSKREEYRSMDYGEILARYNEERDRCEALYSELAEMNERLFDISENGASASQLREKIAELDSSRDALLRRNEIWQSAISIINEAKEKVRTAFSETIVGTAREIADMAVKLNSKEKDTATQDGDGATADASSFEENVAALEKIKRGIVYVAAKVALSRFFCTERAPIFIELPADAATSEALGQIVDTAQVVMEGGEQIFLFTSVNDKNLDSARRKKCKAVVLK